MAIRSNERWAELGLVIRDRRTELNLTQPDVQRLQGPSVGIQSKVENGSYTKKYGDMSDRSKRDYEKALGWKNGSINKFLDGGEVTVAPKVDSILAMSHIEADRVSMPEVKEAYQVDEKLLLHQIADAYRTAVALQDWRSSKMSTEDMKKVAWQLIHSTADVFAAARGIDREAAFEVGRAVAYALDARLDVQLAENGTNRT